MWNTRSCENKQRTHNYKTYLYYSWNEIIQRIRSVQNNKHKISIKRTSKVRSHLSKAFLWHLRRSRGYVEKQKGRECVLFMNLLNKVRLNWNRNTQKLAKDLSNVVYSMSLSLEPLRITKGCFQWKPSVWPSSSVFFPVNVSCLYKINFY